MELIHQLNNFFILKYLKELGKVLDNLYVFFDICHVAIRSIFYIVVIKFLFTENITEYITNFNTYNIHY